MLLSLIRMIQAFRDYQRNVSELSQLSDRELADIGLDRSDIPRVAAGNFNGDAYTDLAIGVPFETVSGHNDAGSVTVLSGSLGAGLTGAASTVWNQATPGIGGTPEANDQFGSALSVLRTRSASRDDLLVGDYYEAVGSTQGAGAAEFIPSSANGLTATDSQLWDDGVAGVKGSACTYCLFGYAVA